MNPAAGVLLACLLLATCSVPLRGTTLNPDFAHACTPNATPELTFRVGPMGALPNFIWPCLTTVAVCWLRWRRR